MQLSYSQISRRLRIPVMTCHQALKQYLSRGRRFMSGRERNSCPEWRKKLAPLSEDLLSRETLQRWSGLTL